MDFEVALTRFLVKGEASVHVHHLSPCSPGPNVPVEQRGVHSSYFCCLQNLKKISKTFSGFFFLSLGINLLPLPLEIQR